MRLDDVVAEPTPPGEPRAVTVSLLLAWPSTATREEVECTLSTLCENTLAAFDRKLRQAS